MKEAILSSPCRVRLLARNRSLQRATRGWSGCNRFSTARTTLRAWEKAPTFTRKTRRKLLLLSAIPLTAPMKPIPKSQTNLSPLLAFGAHPDDIEFACGGVVARETRLGRKAHFVICSRGEAATHGSSAQRSVGREERRRWWAPLWSFLNSMA